jgi:branched-subunit amino acid ABC-type transport system permease component
LPHAPLTKRTHGNLRHPHQALFGQLLLGLVNGSFYAMLSLGLAVIFGLLNIINFAHGALYMLGAFVAWIMLTSWASATGGALCWRRSWSAPRHHHRAH